MTDNKERLRSIKEITDSLTSIPCHFCKEIFTKACNTCESKEQFLKNIHIQKPTSSNI